MAEETSSSSTASKILTEDRLLQILQERRTAGVSVVFTNGCFDLLHAGHIEVLERAREMGDILVVALNTDRSVSKLKGPARPIVPEQNRARVIAALACVSFVTLFDEETPETLIHHLAPDVLVKGGDWSIEKIAGGEFVLAMGGKVCSIPLIRDSSTTGLIERICARYSKDSG